MFFRGEDGAAIYKERCEKNGVNPDRVVFLHGAEIRKGRKTTETDVALTDMPVIRRAIQDTAEKTGVPVRVMFIDPLLNYLSSPTSSSKVRQVLSPLQELAEEMNVAIVAIHHFRKTASAHFAGQIGGAESITSTPRAVFGVLPDPTTNVRYFAYAKANYGEPTAVSYRIEDGKVKILETDIEQSAEEIDNEIRANKKEAAKGGGRVSKKVEASIWLSDFLKNGEMPVKEIYEAAKEMGFKERTIETVKAELGIKSKRHGCGKGSYSAWSLPLSDHTPQKLLDVAFCAPIKPTEDMPETFDN